jgi:hypothetical protein
MSDFRDDPNFIRHEMREYDSRVQWAAVAVILLLVGGLIIAAAYTGGETQTAMNSPAAETTGSAAPWARPRPCLRRRVSCVTSVYRVIEKKSPGIPTGAFLFSTA